MKLYILTLVFSLVSFLGYAQQITREGNTFISSKTIATKEEVKTKYTYKDSKNNEYPVYITAKGACYIKRISQKTGKEYKQYLPKEIQEAIKKELNIITKSN